MTYTQHGWILKLFCMKKVTQRLHTICFHLYEILENITYSDREQISGCLGKGVLRRAEGRNVNGTQETLWGYIYGYGYVHYLDCVGGFTSIHICQSIKLFMFIQFVICQWYFHKPVFNIAGTQYFWKTESGWKWKSMLKAES